MKKMDQLELLIKNIGLAYEIGDTETAESHEATMEEIITGQLILGGREKECKVKRIKDDSGNQFQLEVSFMGSWDWLTRYYYRQDIFAVYAMLKRGKYNLDQGE